jgi:adenine-specific DNA methylase
MRNVPDDHPRLIEVAFPLKQASLDSVHEKNVRHGHISTLHIWPARRPLAACRAALIATLLPDPGNDLERQRLLERLAGKVVTKNTTKRVGGRDVPVVKEETVGGILHWGRENGPDLEFFREEIRKVYGRPPRVLDPFAGGGAIPLEAMRLGCEATAIDINPVAWFILKCTLEYPQRLAGQTRPLPRFALESPEFMADFLKQTGRTKKVGGQKDQGQQGHMLETPEADLAWHVRAWGHWVLQQARADLERFYPTVGGKTTVAYLWARTLTCKNCRATLPLLKTLWLCRKEKKRFRLKLVPRADRSGVDFEIVDEPKVGGNAAQQRAHDRRVGQGTLTGKGAWCPCCSTGTSIAMTLGDIQAEFQADRSGEQLTCVILAGSSGKEYHAATKADLDVWEVARREFDTVSASLPYGPVAEPIDPLRPSPNARGLSGLTRYGLDEFRKLFNRRQMLALATLVLCTSEAKKTMLEERYPSEWADAIVSYLALGIDRLADRNSSICHWDIGRETISNTFQRYALRINWDYCEVNPFAGASGSYQGALDWIALVIEHVSGAVSQGGNVAISLGSATSDGVTEHDIVLTDPPYYDAIPYCDLSDFFYVWLRRTVGMDWPDEFKTPLTPKGEELVEHNRFGAAIEDARLHYEEGMATSFQVMHRHLPPNGRLVIVFANKQPAAWETLVSAIIRSGFVVTASWPIQTEMPNKSAGGARLASSVWLVCRKRPETARPGWDAQVLEEMRSKIYDRLRDFWDAGIRGPDFVWAATGPALEAYSKHPVVKQADEPNAVLTVSEFLHHVRRIVVDYVVGRVLSRDGESEEAASLDSPTIYYLLHRHDFGFAEAPVGACILYAQSCNLRDRDLADRYDLVSFTSGSAETEGEEEEESEEAEEEPDERGSGSKVRLKRWDHRRGKSLGLDAEGRSAPLIDRVHRIMRLWREGDVQKVDAYIEDRGLRGNALFPRLLQALIELARKDNQPDERALLETIMNHVTARGAHPQMRLAVPGEES